MLAEFFCQERWCRKVREDPDAELQKSKGFISNKNEEQGKTEGAAEPDYHRYLTEKELKLWQK